MSLRILATILVLLGQPQLALAQEVATFHPAQTSAGDLPVPSAPADDASDVQAPVAPFTDLTPGTVTFGARAPINPFTAIGHDLRGFFSRDTASVFAVVVPTTLAALALDQRGIEESQEHLPQRAFEPGNIGGSFYVQAGAAVGTWAVGRLTGNEKTAAVGSDLIRAQLLSQAIVQSIKFTTRRDRPDGSNRRSFPSGHTASAFTMATVLQRHLGMKVGVPAYAFATYVGLARMSANKHHMSDILLGAGIGIAAGRTVTMSLGGATFDMGVTPTQGGAAVTFTKR